MGDRTGISWTDASWNPFTGCSLVSPGCTHCYAQVQAARIVKLNPKSHYVGTVKMVKDIPVWTGILNEAPPHIFNAPLKWKAPRRIFVNSMSDLFHEALSDEQIDRVFAIMAMCPQHIFQILTKRSKRMREYAESGWQKRIGAIMDAIKPSPVGTWEFIGPRLNNAWLGVSCEDQTRADERIPDLLATPAAVRWVSAEPLLAPIDFKHIHDGDNGYWFSALTGEYNDGINPRLERPLPFPATLNWIVVGGESGEGFRPMHIEWAKSIFDQCKAAGTKYYFKQDCGPRSGKQGRASDELWSAKEYPA